jgi:hypothetical protein
MLIAENSYLKHKFKLQIKDKIDWSCAYILREPTLDVRYLENEYNYNFMFCILTPRFKSTFHILSLSEFLSFEFEVPPLHGIIASSSCNYFSEL